MSKARSMFKKIKTIAKSGLEPIEEGLSNFTLNIPEVERKAEQRAMTCIGCKSFEIEPIDLFKIQDERIPELSDRMCNECGCASPYLLRQDIKICKKWEE